MTRGERALNIEFSDFSPESIEYNCALLIDYIFDIETNNVDDRERKENAIRHIVEAYHWISDISNVTDAKNDSGIILR